MGLSSSSQPSGGIASKQEQHQQSNGRNNNDISKNNNGMTRVKSDILHNSASNLPMPSPKLQATYITNLLDNKENNDRAISPSSALKYLTEVRGLTKQTLRKFGVGLGSYQFPSIEPGQHNRFVGADCVTFPWIMKASEVHEQETLRGGCYKLQQNNSSNGKEDEEGPYDPFVTRRIKARSLTNKGNQRLDPPGYVF